MIINSLWHDSNSTSSIWKEHIETHNNEYVYINSLFSLISTGTEHTVSKGQVPQSCFSKMKVPYMSGQFSLPIKYGYNLIGREKDSDKLIQCMHPHQDFVMVRPEDAHFIPAMIPPKRATLFGTLETVINGIWDAQINLESKPQILIVGAGLIGVTLALTLKHLLKLNVAIQEIQDYRIQKAIDLGFELANKKGQYDLCFHTSGNSAGLQYAIDRVGFEGKVIEMSWYGDQSVNLRLGESFHYDRKQIISSQVSAIPGHKKPAWSFESRRQLAWQYLQNPIYDQLITHEIPFAEAPEFFDKVRKGANDFLGCVIKY